VSGSALCASGRGISIPSVTDPSGCQWHVALGFEYCHNLGVEGAAPFLEQATIGHFVGQRVLEGVGMLRKEASLVQELGRLEVR
jgi:hypothetical protein